MSIARSGRPSARSASASMARCVCRPVMRWYARSSAIAVCHAPAWYAVTPAASRTAATRGRAQFGPYLRVELTGIDLVGEGERLVVGRPFNTVAPVEIPVDVPGEV